MNIVDIESCAAHNIAVDEHGRLWTWGLNQSGQLGDGTTDNKTLPVMIPEFDKISAIACGRGRLGGITTIALKTDGSVWTWGNNENGELGLGHFENQATPARINGLSQVKGIAGGTTHVLVVKEDGSVWGWGSNKAGQLGISDTQDQPLPVKVPGISQAIAVVAGSGFSVALTATGDVWTWGYNSSGQLGNGSNTDSFTPVRVSGLTQVVQIAAGRDHTLALTANGTAWAWGNNHNIGNLGNGNRWDQNAPVQVLNLTEIIKIAAGFVTVS